MKINKYPDGSSYVEGSPEQHRDHTFKVNSYEDLWHLNQWVDTYVSTTDGLIPTIVIPNLIDAQADRRFAKNQSSGLKLVCQFLNNMNAKFKIFHPHNPEVVEALMDNVEIIDNTYFIKNVLSEIYCSGIGIERDMGLFYHEKISDLILMSSDAGGFKPLMKLCDKISWKGEVYSASKSRSWDENDGTKLIQQVDREDFNGKDALIVDDLSIGGGTFKGLSKLLRKKNIGNLYLAVSHMTIENLGKDSVTNYFDRVFTTNSKFNNYYVPDGDGGKQPKNLTVIKQF